MAKKRKPTISEIAKRERDKRGIPPEDKTKWMRKLKHDNPELAAEVLAYIRSWKFEPNSEAKADCPQKSDLRVAVQATLEANGLGIVVEVTTFSSLVQRLERT